MSDFNQETGSETTLENFKEELWNTVVKFKEHVLMGTGLDEKARKELLSKIVKMMETRQKTGDDENKDSSTLKQKTDDNMIEDVREDKVKTNNKIKKTDILKPRERLRQELEGMDQDKEFKSVMIAATTPSRGVKSRKSKREVDGLSSHSVNAVSEKNLSETARMVLARWKTAAKGWRLTKEADRGSEGDGDLHKFGNGKKTSDPRSQIRRGV